jgi:hypothetical protein
VDETFRTLAHEFDFYDLWRCDGFDVAARDDFATSKAPNPLPTFASSLRRSVHRSASVLFRSC